MTPWLSGSIADGVTIAFVIVFCVSLILVAADVVLQRLGIEEYRWLKEGPHPFARRFFLVSTLIFAFLTSFCVFCFLMFLLATNVFIPRGIVLALTGGFEVISYLGGKSLYCLLKQKMSFTAPSKSIAPVLATPSMALQEEVILVKEANSVQ